MKKVILPLIMLLVVAAVGVAVYFWFFTPSARATATADSFMKAALGGDTQTMQSLYPQSAAIPSSSVIQRNYKRTSMTPNSTTYYILYSFTDNNSPTKIRLTIESSKITKITAGDTIEAIPSNDKQGVVQQQSNTSPCLSKADLSYIDSTAIYAEKIRGATMIFRPDSSEFQTTTGGNLLIDRMADFYKKAHTKDFIFELRGYRHTGDTPEAERDTLDDLLQKRMDVLLQGLQSRGVPLDRITVNKNHNYYDLKSTNLENALYVDINIVNRCSQR